MKRRLAQCSAVASLFAAMVFAPTAMAQNKCDNPRTVIDQRACAKAAESMEALHQFVWRTRLIWNLNMADYTKTEQPRIFASVSAKSAPDETQVDAEQATTTESR